MISLLVATAAVAAAFFIAGSILRPLRVLTRAARKFGAGDRAARAEIGETSPVRELGETFNHMADQIAERENELKKLDRLKSEFVSNVSHELRTLLTTIKTLVRVLQTNKISAAEREGFLETIAVECDRQIEFVQTLLDLSRIESGAYKILLLPANVAEVLLRAVEAHRQAALRRRLVLKSVPPDAQLPPALTDAGALRQIVSSLIENAMKYTPENGEIQLSAAVRGGRIAVEISDDGCGIAKEDIPRIFEKFYRGHPLASADSAENADVLRAEPECGDQRETAGIGLELYLVQNLNEQIGGKITVESPVSTDGRGARFTVLIPVSETKFSFRDKV